jgi:hypothetical protein
VGDAVGISLFVLERGTPGLRWEQPATGIAGEPVADLILEGVQVPADALLGELGQAWAALEAAHELLLAAACAEAVGTLQAVLDASCEYARTRRQFGVALSSFQVIAHRLVDMFTQVQLAHSMADLAAATLAQAGPQRHLRLAACKAQISAACRFVGEQAVQIHGGIGMTDELALSHQVRRLLAIDRRWATAFIIWACWLPARAVQACTACRSWLHERAGQLPSANPAAHGAEDGSVNVMSPLHGTRIIDMTSVLMGPFASQTLADMGADVIKIEAPVGDVVRQIGPARHAGMGPIFLNTNRNKRSVVLDLKHPEGVAALKRLLVDADVLMYNVRPQAMARLGLDYDSVRAINPRLVYAGCSVLGRMGPTPRARPMTT